MKINVKVNGIDRHYDLDPMMRLRDLLVETGHNCVRDSDDAEGFCGSDTVLLDGELVYSNLVLVGEVDGCEVITPDSLGDADHLTPIQQAMVDAGVVQSAYNAPAAALILTWLMDKYPDPTREQIKDALSGIFIRDASYEHYYLAVQLAKELKETGAYQSEICPEFRPQLHHIGKNQGKVDGPQLVAGEKAFVEDYIDPDTCYMVMLRSPYAMAYIKSIDTSEAEKVPGVIKIIDGYNCPDVTYMQAGQGNPEPSPHDRKLFNLKMRFVGERVAAVVAETLEIAIKARDLIKVEYEPLPAVFTVEEALAENAPRVHNGIVEYNVGAPDDLEEYNKECADPREGKVFYQFPLRADIHRNIAASNVGSIGDVEKAFADADAVVERTYQTTNVQHTPLETHICFAKMDANRLVMYASSQVPYHTRRVVAWITGLPENRIHIIKTRIGGGYGSKQDILIEDVVGYAAYITRKPVFYHHTREEELTATSSRHPMRCRVKMSGTKDGKLTGIFIEVRANTGPYGNHCLTVPMNSCSKTLPLFKCDNMAYDLITCYTNSVQAGAYQGYGTPKGNFALQMALCELAEKLGVDYKEFVLNNCVEPGYWLEILRGLGEGREGTPVPVGSCGLSESVKVGCDMIEWGKKEVSDDPDWKIGKGFAMIMQGSGLPGLDHGEALAILETDGSILCHSGGSDLGTGLDTISVKILAEILKVPFERITVTSGDTDSALFDTGAYASSGTFFSGGATVKAAEALRDNILKEAALQMDEEVGDLEIQAPGVVVSNKTGASLSFYEISHTACSGAGRGQVIGHGTFITTSNSAPYGAHFAQVAVNIKTGEVKVQKFYCVQDAGTPINPEYTLTQMYGGALKSIGHTLYEDMTIADDGTSLRRDMTTYGAPMIYEQPDDFKSVLVDVCDEAGPFGAKSVSEIACNGAAPAIGNAIHDACGVWISSWPMTPEKILKELGRI